jgi:hypothetical protein
MAKDDPAAALGGSEHAPRRRTASGLTTLFPGFAHFFVLLDERGLIKSVFDATGHQA